MSEWGDCSGVGVWDEIGPLGTDKAYLVPGYGKVEEGTALEFLVGTLIINYNHSYLITVIWLEEVFNGEEGSTCCAKEIHETKKHMKYEIHVIKRACQDSEETKEDPSALSVPPRLPLVVDHGGL